MPKFKIKASSITNLTDARYFAAMLVDYLGFQLDLSHDDRISPEVFHGIKAWVEGPQIVAQVGKTPADLLQEVYAADDFDLVACDLDNNQFPQAETIYTYTPTSLQALAHQEFAKDRIYQLDLAAIDEQEMYRGRLLSELCAQHKIFVSAPSHEGHIRKLIEEVRPYGISVQGGAEEKVGFKSYDELDVFFDQLEIYS